MLTEYGVSVFTITTTTTTTTTAATTQHNTRDQTVLILIDQDERMVWYEKY